jgi:hypothetical protein
MVSTSNFDAFMRGARRVSTSVVLPGFPLKSSRRLRPYHARNCVSRSTFLGQAFRLIEGAEITWRRINGPKQITLLPEGIAFKDCDRYKTINPVSRNLPPDVIVHQPLIYET